MTHPDIRDAEIYGYPSWNIPEPIGKCKFCGADVYTYEFATDDDEVFCGILCRDAYRERRDGYNGKE